MRNEVPIDTIFDNFDLKKNEIMDLHEFSKICFVLDKDLLEDEIETMFAMTDLDNDGIIKLEEFRKLFWYAFNKNNNDITYFYL